MYKLIGINISENTKIMKVLLIKYKVDWRYISIYQKLSENLLKNM